MGSSSQFMQFALFSFPKSPNLSGLPCWRSVTSTGRVPSSSHPFFYFPLLLPLLLLLLEHIIIVFVQKDMIPPLHKLHEFDES